MRRAAVMIGLLLSSLSNIGADISPKYDGSWWLSLSKQEQLGFVEGYTACYQQLVDLNGKFTESSLAYVPRVTDYVQKHSSASAESVDSVLSKIASPPYANSLKDGPQGERWKEKWGYFDGDYWRQTPQSARVGFIEGFLECYANRTHHPDGSFSKSKIAYVSAISEWYGVKTDDDSIIRPDREATKIPDVLFRFRDAGRAK